MNALSMIFADSTPWYGDFQFWGVFIAVVGGCTTVTWFLAKVYYARKIERAADERERLAEDLKQLRAAGGPKRTDLEAKLAESEHDNEELRAELTDSKEDADRLRGIVKGMERNLELSRQNAGMIWQARVTDPTAPFVLLKERRTPIVAVLNLKGGVGKTTVTANLGAAFARMSKTRVLLIDLDLQASLSSLYLTGEELQVASDQQRLIQHFFEQRSLNQNPALHEFARTTNESGVDLIGSSDTLAYAELSLSVQWLIRRARHDPRLLLRQALHSATGSRPGIVLIDCPPLLNISCVNALAAADYLLIPVMPSRSVTERAPAMMAYISALRKSLNPDLKILGVVANRILKSTGMSAEEGNLWKALRSECLDSWGGPVRMCDTFIPQSTEIRDAERDRRPLHAGDKTYGFFVDLAMELVGQLPLSSRPTLRETMTTGSS